MSGRSVRRRSMLISAAVAGVVALSGCSTDETAAPTSASQTDEETTTITTTTTVEDDSEDVDTPNPDVDDNDSDGGSSAPTQEEAFGDAIADLSSMEGGNGSGWKVTDNTNWDTTSELTFATAVQNEITHSTTSSAVVLFHKGKYVGTAGGSQTINSVDGDGSTVTVNFFDVNKMIEEGGAFAFKDEYNAPVTYSWDGSGVAQEGEIPKA